VLARLVALRQHRRGGQRSPLKPLLVLLALGRLAASGSSALPWPQAESALADLIAEFGPPSRTGRAQGAAYPFTRLRSDGVWVLASGQVVGRFETSLEAALRASPDLARAAARNLVLSNFPETVAPDVLEAAGLDPRLVLNTAGVLPGGGRPRQRAPKGFRLAGRGVAGLGPVVRVLRL
jgi:putative restriction endonuclease